MPRHAPRVASPPGARLSCARALQRAAEGTLPRGRRYGEQRDNQRYANHAATPGALLVTRRRSRYVKPRYTAMNIAATRFERVTAMARCGIR